MVFLAVQFTGLTSFKTAVLEHETVENSFALP